MHPDAHPTPEQQTRQSRAVHARWGTSAIFLLNGLAFATWVLHIPTVKNNLNLEPATLGLALLGLAAGSLPSMPLAGKLIARHGSRPVTAVSALANPLVLLPLLYAPNAMGLFLALALYGAVSGCLDVAMNAQGVAVERQLKRPVMSSFHAFFSLGGLIGAGVGALLIGAGLSPTAHIAVIAAALLVVAVIAARPLLPRAADQNDDGPAGRGALSPGVLLLGALGFLGLLGEGAIADWSAVYARDVLRESASAAGLGFAAFSLAMTAGRLGGDRLREHLGDVRLVVLGGLLAGLGLGAALLAPSALLAAPGFAAFGLGVANIVPVLFSAAGRHGQAGNSIAQVSFIAYLGFLAGPPMIGLLAQVAGLRAGLLAVAVGALLIALLARTALRRS